jgi:Family of unknown function (DUF6134)
MIARRRLLAGGAALAAVTPATAIALPPELRFDVMRNGSKIGQHAITFRQDGDTILATVAVEIVVRLGPIPLFRYTHSVRETWRGGSFATLDSETNDDGKPFHVHAARTADGVVVESSAIPRAVLPPGAIPLTHWNVLCMERPLFNPQDGVRVDSRVIPHGEEMVALAGGTMVRATHYTLAGSVNLDDWYDSERLWTALRSAGTDGSAIEYRRAI